MNPVIVTATGLALIAGGVVGWLLMGRQPKIWAVVLVVAGGGLAVMLLSGRVIGRSLATAALEGELPVTNSLLSVFGAFSASLLAAVGWGIGLFLGALLRYWRLSREG